MILFLVFILMPPNLFFFWAARYFFCPQPIYFQKLIDAAYFFFLAHAHMLWLKDVNTCFDRFLEVKSTEDLNQTCHTLNQVSVTAAADNIMPSC